MLDKLGIFCFGFVLILISLLIVIGCIAITDESEDKDQQTIEDEQTLETTLHVFRTVVQTNQILYH